MTNFQLLMIKFFIILLLILSSTLLSMINMETIHGTTILNWPFINQRKNGQFEGFCVDLLNELSPLMGITYTLQIQPDNEYGGWLTKNGTINGMIGEVMNNPNIDFAIGDLTVLSNRARFVDFTIPIMEYGLSALIRKDILQKYGENIRTFKELFEQTKIQYGIKKFGSNLPLFHDSPVVAKMYSYLDTHPSSFVNGELDGLQRVKNERFAFITESPFIEFLVQRDCNLIAIDDRRKNFQFEYAIALKQNSTLKKRFDRSLRILKNSGKLSELKDKYWLYKKRNCPNDIDFDPNLEITKDFNPFNNNNNINKPNSTTLDRLRQFNRHIDHINDDDFEIIKPRTNHHIRTRRPIIINHHHNNNTCTIIFNYKFLLLIILLINYFIIII